MLIFDKDKSEKAKIKLALVGCGYVSQKHLKAILYHQKHLELKAICDNDTEKLKLIKFKLLFDLGYKQNKVNEITFLKNYQDLISRNIVAGSGQTNFLQNDILTGSNLGAQGTISTMTTVSATTIGITGTQIGTTGNPITANAIYTTLKNEMNTYTNIKETNAVVTMTGAGQQYSDTQIAHNLTSQRTTLNPSQPSTLQPGQLITSANLESFISSLANAYSTERGNTYTFTKTICQL